MDGDKTVTSTFTQDQYTLTVITVGSGSVSRLPDQPTYALNTVVQLTATPAAGWSFSAWSGDLIGSLNPDTITMNGDKTVTATFTQDQYTLTVITVGSGSVSRLP
ncbi:MAG: cell wall-binding protein, partial [Dehalococcoidia bacterium]